MGTRLVLVAVEESTWVNPVLNTSVQNLSGHQLVEVFWLTARTLHLITSKVSLAGTVGWDPKDHVLYLGLCWLKSRADQLAIELHPCSQSFLSEELRYQLTIFDPLQQPWLYELLNA